MIVDSKPGSLALLCGLLLLVALFFSPQHVASDTSTQIAAAIRQSDAYISNTPSIQRHVHPGDLQRLLSQTRASAGQGVPEKLAIVSTYPSRYADAYAAARALRQFIDFSGVLVMVAPHGIGVSSDKLTLNEIRSIEQQTAGRCVLVSYTDCAIAAGRDATSRIKADEATTQHNASIFWAVILALLAAVIVVVVWFTRRRQKQVTGQLGDLRRAASNTLSLADSAVTDIESALEGSPGRAAPDVRAEYDRALGLRDRARAELGRASTAALLTQANEDAAQSVLALQGVMKRLGLDHPLANPLDVPGHRCFYCGHDDRPPYTARTIEDGRGNSMQVEVCSVCAAQLQRGQQPQVATVAYGGAHVPWWAVPTNPWYYSYGGPTWQNWLPFFAGMEIGSWMNGGWGGGWGSPVIINEGNAGGGWDNGAWAGGGAGDSVPVAGDTVDPSTDYGAGDFGGWGNDAGSSSGGDWGGDSGGGDWGGDSGGGDWGGDSGGGGGGDGW